jgi:quercetin dioxygenase-like cupin family protein
LSDNTSLTALAREQLALARSSSSGRSAHSVVGGQQRTLRQTLIALLAGRSMSEHENTGEATVQILRGRVRLSAGDASWSGATGHLIALPGGLHSLEAEEDSVILLTTVVAR